MDARGVDRPIAVVCGRRGPLAEALVLELARRGYDVHLTEDLAPDPTALEWPAALRLHTGSTDVEVVTRVRRRFRLAVLVGMVSAEVLAEVGTALHDRAEARLLLVQAPEESRQGPEEHGPTSLLGAPRTTTLTPLPATRGHGRSLARALGRARHGGADQRALSTARRGLRATTLGEPFVDYAPRGMLATSGAEPSSETWPPTSSRAAPG